MTDDISETDDLESRWPKDGDRLFIESEWAYDAHIVRHPGERFYRMPMGYKRAGDILAHKREGQTYAIDASKCFCNRK